MDGGVAKSSALDESLLEAHTDTALEETREQNQTVQQKEQKSWTTHAQRRAEALSTVSQNGDPLPPGICESDVDDVYVKEKQLTDLEGAYGRIFLSSRKGSSTKNDIILKSVLSNRFDPIELLPLRLALPFVGRLESVFTKPLPMTSPRQRLIDRFHARHRHLNKLGPLRRLHNRVHVVWIAQPYYSGGDMHGYRIHSPEEALSLITQIAYGVWRLHRAGLIYGDMKPENVFWTDSNKQQIVLADFGLVTPCYHAGKTCGQKRRGTRMFMAPSVLSRTPYGQEVDWWALGTTIMEMMSSNCYRKKNNKMTEEAIKQGVCVFTSSMRIMQPAYAKLRALVLKLSSLSSFNSKLANDEARKAMLSDDPRRHPVLSDPYFRKVNWTSVCTKYYTEKECMAHEKVHALCSPGVVVESDPQKKLLAKLRESKEALLMS
eukprot:TRINITY_DN12705_c0_g2_i1.p1 TRINITY_DN12705_c0_g2~~TRINITY_DN12705_c0_g2_i1.p1  ORF type:complete len:484 (-),score=39.68 TRINITY_DN12705_c0_g2_i1:260-1558(-)